MISLEYFQNSTAIRFINESKRYESKLLISYTFLYIRIIQLLFVSTYVVCVVKHLGEGRSPWSVKVKYNLPTFLKTLWIRFNNDMIHLNVFYLYIFNNHTTCVLVSLSNFNIVYYFIFIQLKKNYVEKILQWFNINTMDQANTTRPHNH